MRRLHATAAVAGTRRHVLAAGCSLHPARLAGRQSTLLLTAPLNVLLCRPPPLPPRREAVPVPGAQAGGRPQPALCGAGGRGRGEGQVHQRPEGGPLPLLVGLSGAHATACLHVRFCGGRREAGQEACSVCTHPPPARRPTHPTPAPARPSPPAGRAGAARGADRPAAAAGVREAAAGSGQHAAARRRRRRHRRVRRAPAAAAAAPPLLGCLLPAAAAAPCSLSGRLLAAAEWGWGASAALAAGPVRPPRGRPPQPHEACLKLLLWPALPSGSVS